MPQMNLTPKSSTKRLLSVLSPRAREVLVSRFGLGKDTKRFTLEAIGKKYGITRERVRQVENYALTTIRKSPAYEKEKQTFEKLEKTIDSLGGVIAEEDLLLSISKDASTQNHIHFLLVVGDSFKHRREDGEFKHQWFIDTQHAEKIHTALKKLYQGLSDEDLIPESKIIDQFFVHMKDISEKYRNEEIAKRWLTLSKHIGKNELGEWGMAKSPNIRAKRMRDYAFLIIRRHGSPMHFTEVAQAISDTFNKKAHVATCHNELIKDKRFVLVGRGLYALREWGHTSGVVKDVIAQVLEKFGPLNRDEVIERVLKERYVKENTILVNLQNTRYFRKLDDGRYMVA